MEQQRQLPILTVVQTSDQFERFFIRDEKDRVWTGDKFQPGTQRPTLYADDFDVCSTVHKILKGYFPGVEPVRYVVPMVVEVYSHEPVPESEIAQYLSRTATLQMNLPKHGNGPGSSLVLPRIDWHRMEQETSNV